MLLFLHSKLTHEEHNESIAHEDHTKNLDEEESEEESELSKTSKFMLSGIKVYYLEYVLYMIVLFYKHIYSNRIERHTNK